MLDLSGQAKLLDFGFACNTGDLRHLSTFVGTKSYIAPEIFRLEEFDGYKADIYSLGVILFSLAFGSFPF